MGKRSKTVGSTVPQRQLLNTAGFAPVPTGSGEEQELGVFAGGLSHDPCRASIADTTPELAHLIGICSVLFQYISIFISCTRKVSNTSIQPSRHAEFQKDMHTCLAKLSNYFELLGRRWKTQNLHADSPDFLHTRPGWENQKLQS